MRGREVRLRGRRVVTLLGDDRQFAPLVRGLDTSTPKRRAVRAVLGILVRTHTVKIVARPVVSDVVISSCLSALSDRGITGVAALVAWPGGDRNHRRYLSVSGSDGRPTAFAKMTTDPAHDRASLLAEAELLGALAEHPIDGIRVPRVLAVVDEPDVVALCLEPIPANRRHLAWGDVERLAPLTGPAARSEAPAGLSRGSDSFRTLVAHGTAGESGIAHGDLRPSNAVKADGETWLFDWEYGSLAAPSATDQVSAALTRRVEAEADPDPQAVVDDLLVELTGRGILPSEVARGVGYLAGCGQPWAEKAAGQRWPAP